MSVATREPLKPEDFSKEYWHRLFCVVDLETTGVGHHNGHRIISLGACIVDYTPFRNAPTLDGPHEIFVDPGRPIPFRTTQIHGMRDQDVRGRKPFKERAPAFVKWCQGTILVAHNAAVVEEPMLRDELKAAGIAWPFIGTLDTLPLSRELWPGQSHKLSTLVESLGGTPTGIHTAKGDVITLMYLMDAIIEKLQDHKATLERLKVHHIGEVL